MTKERVDISESLLGDALDRLVLFFLVFCAVGAYSALALARFGLFSSVAVLLLGAIGVVAVSRLNVDALRLGEGRSGFSLASWALLAVVFLGALSAGLFNINEMHAGRDPGIYMLTTEWIASTGTTDFSQEVLEDAYDRHSNLAEIYAGIHFVPHVGPEAAWQNRPGEWELVGQFNDLTPSIRAVFVELFGWSGFGVSTAFFAAASLLMVGMVARRVGSPWVGVGAAALLMTNMSFVYASRTYLTEVPVIFFLFATIYLMSEFERVGRPTLLSAGLVCAYLGLVFFARPDGYLATIAMTAFAGFAVARRPDWSWPLIAMFVVLGLIGLLSFVDLYENTRKYLHDLYTTRSLDVVVFVSLGLGILGLGVSALSPIVLKNREAVVARVYGWLLRFAPALIGAFALVWYIWLMYVGSQADLELASRTSGHDLVEVFQQRRMWELTWYLTAPLVLGFVYFALHVSKRFDGLSLTAATLAIMALAGFLIFTFRTQIYPDHPWVSRRWLPFLTAPVILAACFGLWRLAKVHRIAGPAIVALVVGNYLYSNLRMVDQWMFVQPQREWKAEYDAVAEAMLDKPAAYYFATPRQAASVLSYQYGLPTLALKDGINLNRFEPIRERSPACARAIRNWYGDRHYYERGRRGHVYDRCFQFGVYRLKDGLSAQDGVGRYEFAAGTSGANFLVSNWFAPEDWGSWSKGAQATLDLQLDADTMSKVSQGMDVVLLVDVRAFHPEGATRPIVELRGPGDASVRFGQSNEFRTRRLRIPASAITLSGSLQLKFLVEHATSPAAAGMSGDERVLGVGLKSIQLDVTPSAD